MLAWSGPICCGTGHVLLIDGLEGAHLVPVDLDEAVFGTTSFPEDLDPALATTIHRFILRRLRFTVVVKSSCLGVGSVEGS